MSTVERKQIGLEDELREARAEIARLKEKISEFGDLTSSISRSSKSKEGEDVGFYKVLVENQSDFVVKVTADHRIAYANPAYCDAFGISVENLADTDFKPLIHEEDQPIVEASLARLSHPPYKTEHIERAKTVSGWRWFKWVATGILDEHGALKEFVSVGRDITTWKQTEEALVESEEKFRQTFDRSPHPFLLLDGEGTILVANQTWVEVTGHSHEKSIGRDIRAFLSEASGKEFSSNFADFKKDGLVFDFNLELVSAEGSTHHVIMDGRLFQKPGDYFLQFYCVFRDVTESTRLKDKVKYVQTLADTYFRLASVMFVFLNADQSIQHVNPKACEVLGYDCKDIIGRNWFDLCIPDRDKEEVRKVFGQLIDGKQELAEYYENPVVRRDGTERLIAWRNACLLGSSGEIVGLLSSGEDITEQRKYVDDLQASHRRERDTNRLLESVLDAIPDVIGVQDRLHRIIRYNEAGYRFLNMTYDEVVGKRCFELIGRVSPCDVCATSESYRTKKPAQVVKYVPEIDVWLDVRSYPVLDDAGKIVNVIEHLRDITERKKDEEKLKESQRKLATLFDNLPGMAYRCTNSRDWEMEFVSESCEAITGYTAEELVHNHTVAFGDLIHEEDQEAVWSTIQESIRHNKRFEIEYRIVHKSNEIKWVHEQGVVIASDGQEILEGYIGDITEKKIAQEALLSSEARLRAFFEFSPVGLLILEAEVKGRFLAANETLAKLIDREGEEFVGKCYDLVIHPKNVGKYDEITDKICSTRQAQTMEFHSKRSDGQSTFCLGSFFPVLDSRGSMLAIGGVILDVTELKKALGEKEKLEEQLRQSQKMEAIGRLAGGIAHDFNNLLTGISGNILLAKMETPKDDPKYEIFTEIVQASNRAAELIKQLLAFSRKQIIRLQTVHLNHTVRNMGRMIERIIGEDILLRLDLQEEISPIEADSAQIEQIVINLAINAREAMPSGGKLLIETLDVVLDESYCDDHFDVKSGRYVLLAITDTGHGISKEDQEKVFDPFFSTKPRCDHSGLGLSTVIGIVKQHGGHVQLYSEMDDGTTFKLYFPVSERTEEKTPQPVKRKAEFVGGSETVLVVEDEAIVRKMAEKILKRLGYQTLSARNGREGLQVAKSYDGDIHLLLTDVVMPQMNGKELAKALEQKYPKMKVLFTSGYTENVIAHHGVLDTGVHFISKPYNPKDLSKKLREVLDEG